MLDEEVFCVLCVSTVLGASFKVGDRVCGTTNVTLVMEAGMRNLKVKWKAGSERQDSLRALL